MGEAKRREGQPRTRLTVAVIIPTIPGREGLLERALVSVRSQSRPADQVIVERDSLRTGAAQARNRALARVRTDVTAFLDDDDQFLDHHLKVCMRVLTDNPSVGLVYPAPVMVGGKDPTATSVQRQWRLPWGVRFGPEQEEHLRTFGSFVPMTHLVRTDLVRRIGGFHEGYTLPDGRYRGEDEDYLIRLLDAGTVFKHLNVKTWRWHVNPKSTAGKGLPQ